MLILNIVLMTAIGFTTISLLAWAIRSSNDGLRRAPVARRATRSATLRTARTLSAMR